MYIYIYISPNHQQNLSSLSPSKNKQQKLMQQSTSSEHNKQLSSTHPNSNPLVFGWGKNQQPLLIKDTSKSVISVPQKLSKLSHHLQAEIKNIVINDLGIWILTKQRSLYRYKDLTLQSIDRIYPQLRNIKKIVGGVQHILFIDYEGHCWAMGKGATGCLGNDSYQDLNSPTLVMEGQSIKKVYAGSYRSFFITKDDHVFVCGSNNHGELSTTVSEKQRSLPCRLDTGNTKIKSIAAGQTFTLFLSSEGDIYTAEKSMDTRVGARETFDSNNKLRKLQSKEKFVKIAASNFSAAITQKGQLYLWGTGVFGTFKTPTCFHTINKTFQKLLLIEDNGFGLTDDGQLWVWGKNKYGELGVGDRQPRNKPFPLILLEKHVIDSIFGGNNLILCYSKLQRNKKRIVPRLCCTNQESTAQGTYYESKRSKREGHTLSRGEPFNSQSANNSLSKYSCRSNTKHSKCKLDLSSSKKPKANSKLGKKNKNAYASFNNSFNLNRSSGADDVNTKENSSVKAINNTKQHNPSSLQSSQQNVLKQNNQNIFNTSERKDYNTKINKKPTDQRGTIYNRSETVGNKVVGGSQLMNILRPEEFSSIYDEENRTLQVDSAFTSGHPDNLMKELTQTLKENKRLLAIIDQKDCLINDITHKIKLLEEAIAVRESQQTNRTNLPEQRIIQQLRANEDRYIVEIEKLNSLIHRLLEQQQKTTTHQIVHSQKDATSKQITFGLKPATYNKNPFQKGSSIMSNLSHTSENSQKHRKQYFLDQQNHDICNKTIAEQKQRILCLSQHIEALQEQLHNYTSKFSSEVERSEKLYLEIENLTRLLTSRNEEIELMTMELARKDLSIREIERGWKEQEDKWVQMVQNSRIVERKNGRDSVIGAGETDGEENRGMVQRALERIQENKRRISQSANKLIHVLDFSG